MKYNRYLNIHKLHNYKLITWYGFVYTWYLFVLSNPVWMSFCYSSFLSFLYQHTLHTFTFVVLLLFIRLHAYVFKMHALDVSFFLFDGIIHLSDIAFVFICCLNMYSKYVELMLFILTVMIDWLPSHLSFPSSILLFRLVLCILPWYTSTSRFWNTIQQRKYL